MRSLLVCLAEGRFHLVPDPPPCPVARSGVVIMFCLASWSIASIPCPWGLSPQGSYREHPPPRGKIPYGPHHLHPFFFMFFLICFWHRFWKHFWRPRASPGLPKSIKNSIKNTPKNIMFFYYDFEAKTFQKCHKKRPQYPSKKLPKKHEAEF